MIRLAAAVVIAVFSQVANADSVFSLETNQASYTAGQSATLTVHYNAAPENPDFEYFALSNLNDDLLPVANASTSFGVAVSSPLTAGAYTWTVTVYIRDKKLAQNLNDTITFLLSENQRITDAIGATTDPTQIEALQKERERNLFLIEQAESELVSMRRQVAEPQSIDFEVL